MKGLLVGVTIEGIRSRKDKTMSLTFGTQELEPEKAGEIFSLNGKFAMAYICPKEVQNEDIEVIDSIEPDMPGKTPSQRLRAVLHVMWQQNPEGYRDPNMHYIHYMEEIISKYKLRLK